MIADALGTSVKGIHHIGSTAIPTVVAKPVIDILCVVKSSIALNDASARLERLGYLARGENGIEGRRYFVRPGEFDVRRMHLHVFKTGSDHVERHLAFRDYLLAHPKKAAEYARIKASVSETAPTKQAYQDGKAPFIAGMLAQAIEWHRQR